MTLWTAQCRECLISSFWRDKTQRLRSLETLAVTLPLKIALLVRYSMEITFISSPVRWHSSLSVWRQWCSPCMEKSEQLKRILHHSSSSIWLVSKTLFHANDYNCWMWVSLKRSGLSGHSPNKISPPQCAMPMTKAWSRPLGAATSPVEMLRWLNRTLFSG